MLAGTAGSGIKHPSMHNNKQRRRLGAVCKQLLRLCVGTNTSESKLDEATVSHFRIFHTSSLIGWKVLTGQLAEEDKDTRVCLLLVLVSHRQQLDITRTEIKAERKRKTREGRIFAGCR